MSLSGCWEPNKYFQPRLHLSCQEIVAFEISFQFIGSIWQSSLNSLWQTIPFSYGNATVCAWTHKPHARFPPSVFWMQGPVQFSSSTQNQNSWLKERVWCHKFTCLPEYYSRRRQFDACYLQKSLHDYVSFWRLGLSPALLGGLYFS